MSESDLNPAEGAARPRVTEPTEPAAPATPAPDGTAPFVSGREGVTAPPVTAPTVTAPSAPPSASTADAPTLEAATPPATAAPHPDAAHTEAAPPPAAPHTEAQHTDTAPRPRRGVGTLVAVAAIAALVGGASGAGIAVWAVASSGADQAMGNGPQTITVNDPDAVNVVNAVVAKAAPSVVTIAVSSNSAAGSGSGVIISSDGYVVTNNHVITLDGASADAVVEVTTADGRIFQAEVVGNDPVVDLAVIKLVDAEDLTAIEFGDVDALDVGDRVVAIGAPLGLANTVTTGIVSALDRSIQIASSEVPDDGTNEDAEEGGPGPFNFDIPGQPSQGGSGTISIPVIQTDAAINPGNSGGALVNTAGELVGINVAIASAGGASTTAGSIGVGFAIPADLARRVSSELIEEDAASHGLLGASVRDASSSDGSIVGAVIAAENGIVAGGAADEAGLQSGDIVTSFGGSPITGSVDLTAQVRRHAAGDEVELVYVRDGRERTVTVTLGEYQP